MLKERVKARLKQDTRPTATVPREAPRAAWGMPVLLRVAAVLVIAVIVGAFLRIEVGEDQAPAPEPRLSEIEVEDADEQPVPGPTTGYTREKAAADPGDRHPEGHQAGGRAG